MGILFQREEISFQANIDSVGYNLNEETKRIKIDIRDEEAPSLENWEKVHKT